MLPLLSVLLVAGMLLSVQTALASAGVIGSVDGAPPTYKGTRSCTAFPITSKIDGISGQATVNDDGSRAVFWSTADYSANNPDHNLEVFLAILDGETVLRYTQITSSTGSVLGGFNLAPSISSDGRKVAFFSDRDLTGQNPDGNFEIFVADVSALGPTQLNGAVIIRQVTQSTIGININPSISTDGQYVAFASDRDYANNNSDANSEIFRAEVPTGDITSGNIKMLQVTRTGADVNNDFPAIGANGQQVAFATNSNAAGSTSSGVYHANIASNGGVIVTQIALFNSQTANQIAISADGTRVAYASNQADPSSSTTQVFLANVNLGSTQIEQVTTLTNTNGASNSQPGLNADASRMVWVTTKGPTSSVMMYEPATGVLEKLSDSSENAAPRFTASGLGLVYAANLEAVFGDCSASDLSLDIVGTAPSPLLAGQRFTQTVHVNNLGPGWMRGVVLTSTVPSGAYDGQGVVPQGSCTNVTGDQPIVCMLGTLQKNELLTATFSFMVIPTRELPLVNTVVADALTVERYTPNNTVTGTAQVDGPADLRLTANVTPAIAVAGDVLTYTYFYTNAGPKHSNGGMVTVTLSPEASVLGYPPACTLDRGEVICPFGLIAANVSQSFTVSVRVSPLARTVITNTAKVQGKYDIDSSNDSASLATPLNTSANLGVSLLSNTSTLYQGDIITFTLNISNAGPSASGSTVLTQTLPTGLVWNSGAISTGIGCQITGADIVCPIGTLLPGSSVVATLSATLNGTAGAQGSSTATVGSNDPDSDNSNNSATLNLLLNPVDLQLTKQASAATINAGELLTYVLQVRNLNTVGNATQVRLTDTLPISVALITTPSACNAATNTLICTINTLAPQASQTITAVVQVNPLYRGGSLVNTATVGSRQIETVNVINNSASVATTTTAQVALSISQELALTDVYSGDLADVAVVITNGGPSAATGLVLTDVVPNGMILASAVGANCSGNVGSVRCTIGTLAAGAQTWVTLTLQAQNELGANVTHRLSIAANEPELSLLDNATALALRLNPIDLAIQQSANATVVAGTRITYTLSITNINMLGNATQVRVTQTLPSGVSFVSATAGCAYSFGTVSCAAGTLLPNTSTAITVAVNSLASVRGSLVSTATVGSVQLETNASDNTHTLSLPVSAQIDLGVQQSITSSLLFSGDQFTLNVTVTNNGPSLANGILLTETLPTGVAMTDYSASPALTCSGTTLIQCTVGTLGANASLTAALRLQVNTSRTDVIDFVLAASADEPDTQLGDNLQTITATLNQLDLAVTHLNPPVSAVAGTAISYTLRITNLNTLGSATQLLLTDTLPTALQFLSGSPGCAANNGTLICTLSALGPQATRTITFTGMVSSTARGMLSNSVSIGSAQLDPSLGNNSDSVLTQVDTALDLNVQQTLARTQLFDGDLSTLMITLTNSGPSAAQHVLITETLPIGVSAIGYSASNGVSCSTVLAQCNTIGLDAGQSLTVGFTISVSTLTAGDVALRIDASADEVESITSNNTQTVTAALNTLDIQVGQGYSTPVGAGLPLTYTLSITNPHVSATAKQVVVTDTLPAGTTVLSVPGNCAANVGVITCTYSGIAANTTTSINLVLRVDEGTRGTLTNTVAVAAAQFDPNTTNNSSTSSIGVNANADLQVSHQLPVSALFNGDVAALTITVTNAGPALATTIQLTTTVPNGLLLTNVLSNSSATCAGTPLVCGWSSLAAGQSATLTLNLSATNAAAGNLTIPMAVSGLESDPLPANNTQSQTFALNVLNLGVAHLSALASVQAGTDMTYSLVVTNQNSSGLATRVKLTDTLPNGVGLLLTPAACSTSGAQVLCGLNDLMPGATQQIDLHVWVSDTTRGQLVNTVTVGSAQLDLASSDNSSSITTSVLAGNDLGLSADLSQTLLFAGDTPSLVITLTNAGPAAATGIRLTTTLPSGLTMGSYTGSTGVICSGSTPVCTQATLGAGATMTASLVLSTTQVGTGARVISITARANESDVNLVNNTNTINVVLNQIDLLVDHIDVDPYLSSGDSVTYTLLVTNSNPVGTATSVRLTDTLSSRINYSRATPGCAFSSPNVICSLGSLAALSSRLITITGQVNGNAPVTITNIATATATELDPVISNNTSQAASGILIADVSLSQTVSSQNLIVGAAATMNITMTNFGTGRAKATQLTETLTSGLIATAYNASSGTTCSGLGTQVALCSGPTLNAAAALTVSLQVSATGVTQGAQTITGTISTSNVELTTVNNSATTVITVAANLVDLMVAYGESTPAMAGLSVTSTISITNLNSVGTATNITVSHSAPSTTVFISASPECSTGGSITTTHCLLAFLAPGASRAFTIVRTINAFADTTAGFVNFSQVAFAQPDANNSNNIVTSTTVLTAQANLLLASSVTSNTLMNGDTTTVLMTVTNNGPSGAVGASADVTLPLGLSGTVLGQSVGVSCLGYPIQCALPNLAANQFVTATFAISPNAALRGVVSITIDSRATTYDPVLSNNTQTISVTVNQVDVAIALNSVEPTGAIIAGTPLTYTWRITNLNTLGNATQLQLTDTITGGLYFVTGTQGCVGDDSAVVCGLGSLSAQASRDISLTLMVSPTTRGVVTSSMGLDLAQLDPNLGNNNLTQTTTVATSAPLTVAISALPTPFTTTEPLTYTFVVTNLGPSSASNLLLTNTFTLPEASSMVFYTPTLCSGSSAITTTVKFACALGSLAPNLAAMLQITGQISTPMTATLLTQSAASADEPPNDQSYPVTVIHSQ